MPNTLQTYSSYAKINLSLKVTGRRSDGYHQLNMLNALVSFYDDISLAINNSGSVVCCFANEQALNDANINLAGRAARLLLDKLKIKDRGVEITAKKRIPMGAGLGGGSSNAACVLKNLPKLLLAENIISNTQFENLKSVVYDSAYELGTDIFYFLEATGGISNVTGVGDQIKLLSTSDFKVFELFLVLPKYPISTALVYNTYKDLNPNLVNSSQKYQEPNEICTYQSILKLVDNDLFAAACIVEPRLKEDFMNLAKLANYKLGLSGSGSSMFLLGTSADTTELEASSDLVKLAEKSSLTLIKVKVLANLA